MNKQELLERKLRELILDIQSCDPITQRNDRRKNLSRFFKLLDENFAMYKPKRSHIPNSFLGAYEEICHEARCELWNLIHKMIKEGKYDPERGSVLGWIRFYMNRRCVPQAIKNIIGQKKDWAVSDIETVPLDNYLPSPVLSEQIKMVLELDPSGEFKSTHVRDNSSANFQVLALRVYEKKSWHDLAIELDEKVSTLSCFYQRCLRQKFAAYIRSYIQENL